MGGPLGDLEPYQQALDEAFERHGVLLAYLHRLLCCPDDTVRVAFETRALRQYVATRPLRRIRWRYVTRRITQGRYGRLESGAQIMVDKVYEHLQRTPDDIRFFARCIVEYLERKGHLFL